MSSAGPTKPNTSIVDKKTLSRIKKLIPKKLDIGLGLWLKIELDLHWDVIICPSETKNPLMFVFSPAQLIGAGAQGTVIRAQNLADGTIVAAKIQKEQDLASAFDETVQSERGSLKINKMLLGRADIIDSAAQRIAITFMEYVKGTNLLDFLYEVDLSMPESSIDRYKTKKDIPIKNRIHLISLLFSELIEVHSRGQAHRDLKPSNVVYAPSRILDPLRFIDFGSAVIVDIQNTTKIGGSFGYIPPECYRENPPEYDYFSDYYAFGILLCEILSNTPYEYILRKKAKELEMAGVVHLTLSEEEIKSYFPDIFDEEGKASFLSTLDDYDKATVTDLIRIINTLCHPYEERSQRGSLAYLKAIHSSLVSEEYKNQTERGDPPISPRFRDCTPRAEASTSSQNTNDNPLPLTFTPQIDRFRRCTSNARLRSTSLGSQGLSTLFDRQLSLTPPKK